MRSKQRKAMGASEACDGAEAVVSMLPSGAIVKGVYANEVIGKAPAGAAFLDCSTIDVATARDTAANGGTLTFMVGGTQSAFNRAKPILEAMGKAVIQHAKRSKWRKSWALMRRHSMIFPAFPPVRIGQ